MKRHLRQRDYRPLAHQMGYLQIQTFPYAVFLLFYVFCLNIFGGGSTLDAIELNHTIFLLNLIFFFVALFVSPTTIEKKEKII